MQSPKEFFEQKDGLGKPIKDLEFREPVGKLKKKKQENIRRNIDYSPAQYEELQKIAEAIGITSQAAVKVAVQQFIDNYYKSQADRKIANQDD